MTENTDSTKKNEFEFSFMPLSAVVTDRQTDTLKVF